MPTKKPLPLSIPNQELNASGSMNGAADNRTKLIMEILETERAYNAQLQELQVFFIFYRIET